MKILVAEDNAIARRALAAGLSAEGHEVEEAADGEQALSLARVYQPDFVISDVLMPRMDGYALCQAIRDDTVLHDTPVIFYSATFLEPEDEALARSVGASGFIHKDSDPVSFQRQLQRLIDEQHQGLPPQWKQGNREAISREHQSTLIRKLQHKVEELEAEKRALRESQAFLDHIAATVPDVIFSLSLPGLEPVYIAPGAERLIGYSAEEVRGDAERWKALIVEEDRPRVMQAIEQAVARGEKAVIICRMQHKAGGERWVEARVTPRLDAGGGPLELVGALSDISERRAAEERLRESERSLDTLFRNLPGMAYRCRNTPDWAMEFVSDGVEALTGYHRNELEGSSGISYAELIHPDDREMVWSEVQQALHEKRQISISYRIQHRDGSLRWAWERGVGVTGDDGELHIEGFISDITLRKRAEERVIASEQRYRNLFTMMDSGMSVHELVFDADGHAKDYRFIEVNPAFERLTGLRAEQVVGRTVREALPGIEEQWIEDYIRVAQSGEAARFVRYTAALDRYFDVVAYQTQPDQFVTLFSDVSERKRAEAEIRDLARFPEEDPSPVLRVNNAGALVYANPASRELLEHCRRESGDPACSGFVDPALQALESGEMGRLEYTANGRHYSFVVAPVPEAGYANLYGRDTTRRVEAAQQLERLNRVLRTLSKGNRTLVHAASETELLQRVCEVLAEEGGYPFVWAAYSDGERRLVPAAHCGSHETLQPWLESLGQGVRSPLIDAVLQRGEPELVLEMDKGDWSGVQEQAVAQSGLSAQLLLPIRHRDQGFGLMGIFATSREVFDQTEMELLNEMAGDVAYGIQAQRTKQAHERSMARIQSTMLQTIESVSMTLEKRDPYTAGHQQRVVQLAVAIARDMGLAEQRIEGLRLASLVHDIGKIHVPAEILNRPGRLSDTEFGIIKSHPEVGYDILKGVEFDWPIAEMVLQHHERCDGSGYPQGLKGEEIVLEARIIGVADVVEAITSHRPYRPGLGVDVALQEIENGRGTRYDPDVVDTCLRLFREKAFHWEEGAHLPLAEGVVTENSGVD